MPVVGLSFVARKSMVRQRTGVARLGWRWTRRLPRRSATWGRHSLHMGVCRFRTGGRRLNHKHNPSLASARWWLLLWSAWFSSVCLADGGKPLGDEISLLQKDILQLQQDLKTLQDELLFPDETRVNVFISLDNLVDVELESIELLVKDLVVTSHVYQGHELKALRDGAIQPLYQGNLANGKHSMLARIVGRRGDGGLFRELRPIALEKSSKALFIELRLATSDNTRDPVLKVNQWE